MSVLRTSTSIVLTKYSIDQQDIQISEKKSMFHRTQKLEIGTLAPLASKTLKFLVNSQGSI